MTSHQKCCVLDSDGMRCNKPITKTIRYHGDDEIYSYNFDNPERDMTWVEIGVCKIHERQ